MKAISVKHTLVCEMRVSITKEELFELEAAHNRLAAHVSEQLEAGNKKKMHSDICTVLAAANMVKSQFIED